MIVVRVCPPFLTNEHDQKTSQPYLRKLGVLLLFDMTVAGRFEMRALELYVHASIDTDSFMSVFARRSCGFLSS